MQIVIRQHYRKIYYITDHAPCPDPWTRVLDKTIAKKMLIIFFTNKSLQIIPNVAAGLVFYELISRCHNFFLLSLRPTRF